MSYVDLMRWFAPKWREDNEDAYLHMLEEDARARGVHGPTLGQALMIRSHGIASRATHRLATAVGIVAVVCFAAPIVASAPEQVSDPAAFISVSPTLLLAVALTRSIGVVALGASIVIAMMNARVIAPLAGIAAGLAFLLAGIFGGVDFALGMAGGAGVSSLFPGFGTDLWSSSVISWTLGCALLGLGFASSAALSYRLFACISLAIAGAMGYQMGLFAYPVAGLLMTLAVLVFVLSSERRQADFTQQVPPPSTGEGRRNRMEPEFARRALPKVSLASGVVGFLCWMLWDLNLLPTEAWTTTILLVAVVAPLAPLLVGVASMHVDSSAIRVLLAGLVALSGILTSVSVLLQPTSAPLMNVTAALCASLAAGTVLALRRRPLTGSAAIAISIGALLAALLLQSGMWQVIVAAPALCFAAAFWSARNLHRTKEVRLAASLGA